MFKIHSRHDLNLIKFLKLLNELNQTVHHFKSSQVLTHRSKFCWKSLIMMKLTINPG